MSISSTSSTPPMAPSQPAEVKTPDRTPSQADSRDDDRNRPAPKPPLPPGQGTRIDQYV